MADDTRIKEMMTEKQRKHLITKETARIMGQRGGRQRAINARKARNMAEMCKALLLEKDTDGQTALYVIIKNIIEAAKAGDIRAAAFIRDTAEGKPATTIKAELDKKDPPLIIFDIPEPTEPPQITGTETGV